jgi:hypothetical protein
MSRNPFPAFPTSIFDLGRLFPTEAAYLDYLFQTRWPDGFECPQCGSAKYSCERKGKAVECGQCSYTVG